MGYEIPRPGPEDIQFHLDLSKPESAAPADTEALRREAAERHRANVENVVIGEDGAPYFRHADGRLEPLEAWDQDMRRLEASDPDDHLYGRN